MHMHIRMRIRVRIFLQVRVRKPYSEQATNQMRTPLGGIRMWNETRHDGAINIENNV
jgi:hypothetical protein